MEPYNPQATQTNVNYLTVEGFLNGSGEPTTFRLGRTSPLKASNGTIPEQNATVQIEGDNGGIFALPETNPGTYSATLTVDLTKNFRLKIKTKGQKEYASDFVPFKQTPVIDTVNYAIDGDQLQIFVNAHDDSGNTRYYLWRYVETWSYHSAYQSGLKYEKREIIRRDLLTEDIYRCWKTVPSREVFIGSSARLERDVISHYPLVSMRLASEKLQSKYSLFVEQSALTKDAYEYWQQLKGSTENLGTIFGPLPSQIAGNIHSLSNPDEPVVGFFSACTVRQQRIFIMGNLGIRHETGYEFCELDTLFLSDVPAFVGGELLIDEAWKGRTFLGYYMCSFFCGDCRLHGGTTVKPDFWE